MTLDYIILKTNSVSCLAVYIHPFSSLESATLGYSFVVKQYVHILTYILPFSFLRA